MPKPAYPKYTVLGILGIRPMTAGEVRKWIRDYLSPVAGVDENAAVPALRTLEASGLVRREARGKEGGKNVYLLTPEGEREFSRWMESPAEDDRELVLKCSFGSRLPREVLKEKVRAFRARCGEEIAAIETRENRIASLPDTSPEKPFLRSAARLALAISIAKSDWAQETLAMLEDLPEPRAHRA
ncbi:MAG: PadR family transcriptional regulator [Methanolinea sp.]|nr:PadR family transcriptional regulator [Methanolinea sp.]